MTMLASRRRFIGYLTAAALGGALPFVASPNRRAALAASPAAGTPAPSPTARLVLRLQLVGGFVPVEYLLTTLPFVSIYADGTVITTGPVIEIYPAPALPNLRELILTPAGLARVVTLAQEAGLDGDRAYEGTNVTDAPSTLFTFVENGRSVTVSAYALGFDEERIADPTLRAARAKLIKLQEQLANLGTTLPDAAIAVDDHPYEIARLRIFAHPIDPANPPDKDLPQPSMDWPLASDLATFGDTGNTPYNAGDLRCGVVEGEDAKTLVAALKQANALTPWVSKGVSHRLWNRPLLPDEPSACH